MRHPRRGAHPFALLRSSNCHFQQFNSCQLLSLPLDPTGALRAIRGPSPRMPLATRTGAARAGRVTLLPGTAKSQSQSDKPARAGMAFFDRFRACSVSLVYAFSRLALLAEGNCYGYASVLSAGQERGSGQAYRPLEGANSEPKGGARREASARSTKAAAACLTAKCLQTQQTPFSAFLILFSRSVT